MKFLDIRSLLITLFQENRDKPLSFKEIADALSVKRKDKVLLAFVLNKGIEDNIFKRTKQRYSLAEKSRLSSPNPTPISPKLLEGFFDATPLSRDYSYAFVRTEGKDYFVAAEDTLNAYHNDRVAIEPKIRRGNKEYGIVRRIISRSSESLAGDIVKTKNKFTFVCSNPKIHNWFNVINPGNAKEGDKVILHVTNWGSPILGVLPSGSVIEVLGKSGDPQVELLAVIRQYNLPLTFPDEVMHEVSLISATINQDEISKRVDLRSLFTFTIDPISAKDFDDAISIVKISSGWILYVHIADVAHYLPASGATFREAALRGNSFYFPRKVIPMIPEKLSNLVCSLRPQEDKLCLTVETEFSSNCKIKSQQLYESIICSDYRLSYDEVDDIFSGKAINSLQDYNDKLLNALNIARSLSAQLTQLRNAAGYIFFDLPEIEYQYNEDGFLQRLSLSEETESHKLIENFMLVANEYVAHRLSQLSPISMYRIHEDPDQEKINSLIETLSNYGITWDIHENLNKSFQYLLASLPSQEYHVVFDRIVLRSMKKARYSIEHKSHFGLAMHDYTHFTSPIRRLCDLVIHSLCKTYITKSLKQPFTRQQIALYAQIASDQELKADQAERDIELVFSRAFMKDRIGDHFSGIVIGCNAKGVLVRLNEIPITAVIKTSDLGKGTWDYNNRAMKYVNRRSNLVYQLMDKLKVTVSSVDDDVYLVLQDSEDAHVHYVQVASVEKMFGRANHTQQNKKGQSHSLSAGAGNKQVKKFSKQNKSAKRHR